MTPAYWRTNASRLPLPCRLRMNTFCLSGLPRSRHADSSLLVEEF